MIGWRARAYVATLAVRDFGMAVWAATWPAALWTRAGVPLLSLLPLYGWAAVFAAGCTAAALAAVTGREPLARAVLSVGAVVNASWAAALCILWARDPAGGFAPLAVTWAALAVKDMLVVGFPLRAPLEELAAAKAAELEASG